MSRLNFNPPRFEIISKTAEIFGLPEYLVRTKVLKGEVVAIQAGRKYLVNVDKFAEYLNSNRIEQPVAANGGIRPIGR